MKTYKEIQAELNKLDTDKKRVFKEFIKGRKRTINNYLFAFGIAKNYKKPTKSDIELMKKIGII